jgi:pentatricopeptide repeat protein
LDALVADPQATGALGSRGRYWVGRMAVRMAAVLEQLGRVDEAMDVYRLIVERGLPGVTIAASRLQTVAVSPPR